MSSNSAIEWTDATWNPVTGCDHVSAGCDNCYAERIATRFGRPFIGAVECHPKRLEMPLRWRKPRRVFVNSVSDLFHPEVPDEFIAKVFAVMHQAYRHTFQVLTKRPQRMERLLADSRFIGTVTLWAQHLADGRSLIETAVRHAARPEIDWPTPNVWLGVSVENQRYADLRIPHLLATPAAVRFLSVEPLLGPVDLSRWLGLEWSEIAECWGSEMFFEARAAVGIIDTRPDWVIVGGESGPGARPMHISWARTIRDQCTTSGVPFFFKQWGEFAPYAPHQRPLGNGGHITPEGTWHPLSDVVPPPGSELARRCGKKEAGRDLDGRTWDEMPEQVHA